MAATIARAQGFRRGGAPQGAETHRLGHGSAVASAATWKTTAGVEVWADGRTHIEVRRGGVVVHRFDLGPEPGAETPEPNGLFDKEGA